MSDNFNVENEELKVDSAKLKKMLQRIYRIERENSKTGSKTEKAMKTEIESIIEEEVKKYGNVTNCM